MNSSSSWFKKSAARPFLRMSLLVFSLFLLASHFSATESQAAQAALSWTAPSGTTVSGYKVYLGTSSKNYTQVFNVGNVTSYTLTNLTAGTTYYSAVTDYNSSGTESGYSNEVSKTIPSSTSTSTSTYTITATAGSGGSITAQNNTKISTATNGTTTITSVTVSSGASQSFSITPASGYAIAGVTVDGVSKGAVSSYTFSNVTANHTLQATFTASSTGNTSSTSSTGSTGSTTTFAANAGGAAYTDSAGVSYAADTKFTGGTAVNAGSIAVSGTNDPTLYQTYRYGNFSYSVPVTNGNYSVTLRFAESYFTSAGQRVFNVAINGQTAISNLDVFAKVGKGAAYDVVVPVSVTNGAININFISQVNWAIVSAIKVAPRQVVFATNSGGSQYTGTTGVSYAADNSFTGGTAVNAGSIAVSGTSDPTLYQTYRYGNFPYNIPVANGNYAVTLKFAESYFTSAGKRVFSVAVNGKTMISNLDVYAKVGKNAAYDVVIPVSVTNGTLNINLISQVNWAIVGAILVQK